jgi:tetratricopeptide (TPR) repeat protein
LAISVRRPKNGLFLHYYGIRKASLVRRIKIMNLLHISAKKVIPEPNTEAPHYFHEKRFPGKARYFLGFFFAAFLSSICCHATSKPENKVRSILAIDTTHILALIDSGKKYFNTDLNYTAFFSLRALHLSEKINYGKGEAYARYNMGVMELYRGNYDKALAHFDMSQKKLMEIKNTQKLPNLLNAKGTIYLKQFKTKEAMDCYYQALRLAEINKDQNTVGMMLTQIGCLCLKMEDFPKSRYYFQKALALSIKQNLKSRINLIYVNLAGLNANMLNNDSSLYYFIKVGDYYLGIKDYYSHSHILVSLGNLYRRLGQDDKSIKVLQEALELSRKTGMKEFIGKSLTELAQTYQETGQTDLAIKCAREGLKITTAIGQLQNSKDLYGVLFSIYSQKNQVALALEALEESSRFKDSIKKANDLDMLKKIDSKYLTDKLQQQELFLQQQKILFRTRQVQFYLILLVIIVILVFVLIMFFVQQQTAKRRNKILEQETEINRQKAIINEQENALYEVELNKHRQEILAISTLQGKTNETLLQIIHDLREMAFTEISNKPVSSELYLMASKIEKLSVTDSWFVFRKWFTDIHPHFYENLNRICPSLTNNDLKLASLIRMNLNSKEIASLTLRSLDSIHIARHRLRKKLGIDDDETLVNFLFSVPSLPEKTTLPLPVAETGN